MYRLDLMSSPASERGMQSDLEDFYASGPYSSPSKNSFLAQQANLYVSQVSRCRGMELRVAIVPICYA